MTNNNAVLISKEETESLKEFIELNFAEHFKDLDIDNMQYVYNISNVWKKCEMSMKGDTSEL